MNRMRELVDLLNEKSYQYYTLDNPTIADAEYDRLYDELVRLEAETGERLPDSPTRRVGGAVLAGFEPHTHIARLAGRSFFDSLEGEEEFLLPYAAALRGAAACGARSRKTSRAA